MIQLREISFRYAAETPLLESVTASFAPRCFALLAGSSGCGKSTLLRLLAKLELPAGGEILLDDMRYDEIPSPRLRRQVCLLQQTPVMNGGSVRENLLLSFQFRAAAGLHPPGDETLQALLAEARLEEISLDAEASQLSVGQRQRLALLRALAMQPRFLLLDEPTSALDPDSRRAIEELLVRRNQAEGIGILMVSHGDFALDSPGARHLRLRNGRLEEES